MHKNKNRPGYKNSKVGWIPEEWSETTLGSLLEKHPCYGINAAAVEYSGRLPTYLRITDISEDGYFLNKTKVSVNSVNSNDYMLDNGDLVFARTGASTGKTYLYDPNDGPLVFAGFLIRVRPNPNKLHPQFLKAFTSTYLYWNWISVTSMRSGQPGVNGNEYATMELALPPLPEQKAIAEVLECWDKGIRNLELKIEKMRNVKKWLMQRLLSGKQRLKGYSKEWKNVRLEELGKVTTGNTPPKNNPLNYNGNCLWATAEDFTNKYISNTKLKLSAEGIKYSRLVPAGSVLVTCIASIGLNGIAKVALATNQQINAITVNNSYSNEFVYYLMQKNKKILQLMAGSGAVPILNKGHFEKISMYFPPLDEQMAIADVLSVADGEIEALEKKLALWKEQKKYLLNNLVTGTIRLPQFCLKQIGTKKERQCS